MPDSGVGRSELRFPDFIAFHSIYTTLLIVFVAPSQFFFIFASQNVVKPSIVTIMQTTDLNSFEAWEKNPEDFFRCHREMLADITRKSEYFRHLNKREIAGFVDDRLVQKMLEEGTKEQLNGFDKKEVFLVFYLRIVQKQFVLLSHEEDIWLLKHNPGNLSRKYESMIDSIAHKVLSHTHYSTGTLDDLKQEFSEELIRKAGYILKHYDTSLPFKSYLWKVIKNSFINQLEKGKLKICPGSPFADNSDKLAAGDLNPELKLCIKEGCRQFKDILESYNHDRARLEVSLKTLLSLRVSHDDISKLFETDETCPAPEEIEAVCQTLNESVKAQGFNQAYRFSIIEPSLNKAFKTNTDAKSHLHWTNIRIAEIIIHLNEKGLSCFDRDTFVEMVELYYMKYFD
jgi:DNA-directed RNA polymerase specialized sigma24 family protein